MSRVKVSLLDSKLACEVYHHPILVLYQCKQRWNKTARPLEGGNYIVKLDVAIFAKDTLNGGSLT